MATVHDIMKNSEKEHTVDAYAGSAASSSANEYGIDEKSLLRKLDRRVLPAVTSLYLLSFLDRSNVANARVEGLVEDVKMTGDQYLTGLTLFFVGYILFEVPCNLILRRTTPKIWLPTLTVVFGIVATLLGIVQSLPGFFVARFFLGVAEGGLFPGVVFYLSMWYKRQERQFRVALFFSGASLAGAFGGILAFGIAHMKGVAGLNGWRWIFILEGIFTVLAAIVAYFFIYNYPSQARFLSQDEKTFIEYRLKADSDIGPNESFSWADVASALRDPKCWLYCLGYHTMSLPLYTLSLFLPTIVKALGYSSSAAQLLTIPPYALATILTLAIATFSERIRFRAPFILASSTVAIIGYIILLSNTDPIKHPAVSYVGMFFCAAGIYPSVALNLSWPAVNVSGPTKRATAGGMQISIGNLGAVIGTQLYRTEDSPRFVVGHSVALGYLVANLAVVATTWYVLRRENRKKADMINRGESNNAHGDENENYVFST